MRHDAVALRSRELMPAVRHTQTMETDEVEHAVLEQDGAINPGLPAVVGMEPYKTSMTCL